MLRCGRAHPSTALTAQGQGGELLERTTIWGTRISKRTHRDHHSSHTCKISLFESAGVRRLDGISCYLTYDEATELDDILVRQ